MTLCFVATENTLMPVLVICGGTYHTIPKSSAKLAIGKYKPQDATTNPSLILAASKKPEYAKLIDDATQYAKAKGGDLDSQVDDALDRLLVEFGKEILKIIPGKVSTEVDARFSFDTKASVDKALHIIEVCIAHNDDTKSCCKKRYYEDFANRLLTV
ncbi:hypothetical protein ANO14919_108310 [Xylariales sp. No.14919]|nr:hypothetical protein ANO14919_108310 [Xylariales sp. No.14919]